MPVPDFSPGEVLTAAAMDSIGLWLVKTVTIPASPATTAVDVTSCFNSNFENYKVTYTGESNGTAVFHNLQMLIGTTPSASAYFRNGITMTSNSTTVAGTGAASATSFDLGAQQASTEEFAGEIYFSMPNFARITYIKGWESTWAGGFGYHYQFQGSHAANVAQDGFRISVASGSFNSGSIRVYGLRN
jgi:hypothetical protein